MPGCGILKQLNKPKQSVVCAGNTAMASATFTAPNRILKLWQYIFLAEAEKNLVKSKIHLPLT
jgi:hypothetical protein